MWFWPFAKLEDLKEQIIENGNEFEGPELSQQCVRIVLDCEEVWEAEEFADCTKSPASTPCGSGYRSKQWLLLSI